MMHPILPFWFGTFETDLSLEEIRTKFEACVEVPKYTIFWYMHDKDYIGDHKDNKFQFSKSTLSRNVFPTLTFEMHREAGATMVKAKMGYQTWEILFVTIIVSFACFSSWVIAAFFAVLVFGHMIINYFDKKDKYICLLQYEILQ